ncbi:MAG: ATP-binding protein [Bacillota bacterium]
MKHCKLEADVSSLSTLISFLEVELEREEISVKIVNQMFIVAEEIFVNIAHYAYAKRGMVDIFLEINAEIRQIEMTFQDSGIPFDPLAKPDADITLSSEERGIGGMGILMVKKMTDSLSYRFENGNNILHLKKRF